MHRRHHVDDEGFSLMEVVVAMLILSIVVTAVAALLVNSISGARANTQRVAAANLAQQQIESVRSQRALDIPDGTVQPVAPVTIDGTAYTVTQNASYMASGTSGNLCQGGDSLAFKRVTETITWPNMGSIKPVKADTMVALGLNNDGISAGLGAAAILVQNSSGQPASGMTVVLNPGGASQTTGDDGCAVFAGLATGTNFTATVSQAGYVTVSGAPVAATDAFTVPASGVTRRTLDYDRAGSLAVALTMPAGFSVPAGVNIPLTLDNAYFQPVTSKAFEDCSGVSTAPQYCVSGTPRTAASLFPGTYSAWAGTCADSKPNPAPATVQVASGPIPTTYSAALAGADLVMKDSKGVSTSGTIIATHAVDSGCTSGVSWNVGTGSSIKAALPAGTWTFSVTPTTGKSVAATVTLTAGQVKTPVVVVTK